MNWLNLKKGLKQKLKKRMDEESEIIQKLKNLISETSEFNTDIPLHQQKEIKDKVISDVFDYLFYCAKTCPICGVPCNETHPGKLHIDTHHSRCHRPTGFARNTRYKGDIFITSTCNDFVESDHTFRNADTNYEFVRYRDYRMVNDYYNSWYIERAANDDSLYWKYITYQLTKNFNQFFLQQECQI